MNQNIATLKEKRDWNYHAERIATAWQNTTASIIETGRALLEAKDELDHGSFEAMVHQKLPFDERTAQRLMKIAKHPVLSKATHVSLLPPSWGTLYELTKLPEETLRQKIADHTIDPKMERREVAALRPKVTQQSPSENTQQSLPEKKAKLPNKAKPIKSVTLLSTDNPAVAAKKLSRQRAHVPNLDNYGEYKLVDGRNIVVLGSRYDATLEDINDWLTED